MATLSKHGSELLRIEYPAFRVSYRTDGQILRDTGQGWKLYKTLKSGIDPAAHAAKIQAKHAQNLRDNPARAEFERVFIALGSLHLRSIAMTLLQTIGPDDPDGITSELQDFFHYQGGCDITLDDIVEVCKAAKVYAASKPAETNE